MADTQLGPPGGPHSLLRYQKASDLVSGDALCVPRSTAASALPQRRGSSRTACGHHPHWSEPPLAPRGSTLNLPRGDYTQLFCRTKSTDQDKTSRPVEFQSEAVTLCCSLWPASPRTTGPWDHSAWRPREETALAAHLPLQTALRGRPREPSRTAALSLPCLDYRTHDIICLSL